MTMKHVVDGLMQATKSRNHRQLSLALDLQPGDLSRWAHGKANHTGIAVVARMHELSGVPLDRLFAWYRLPAEAVLGRISRDGSPA